MNSSLSIGIGLRHCHYVQFLNDKPDIDWVEIHSENFFLDGGSLIETIKKVRQTHPVSLHGIGLSLGSARGISAEHLARLQKLITITEPFLVSEHLSWNITNNTYLPDLLPAPYTKESLRVFADNINTAQDFLKREILIENPSTYLEYNQSEFEEADFLVQLCKTTGAKLLLDVNNIFVSSSNHGWSAENYISSIPTDLISEVHLAGHSIKKLGEETLRIDTHDNFVCNEVWALYELLASRLVLPYVLLEWDANIPPLEVLISEAKKALNFSKYSEKHYA